MTPQQFAEVLREKSDELRRYNRPLNVAAASTHTMQADRIFSQGLNSTGSQIGQYSTKDIWVNPSKTATKNNKGFSPLKGKTGATEFKSNPSRKRKTSYFEGWKGLRAAQGLKTDKVNLNFTGDMFFDFARPNKALLQRVDQLSTDEYASLFSRHFNALKAEGAEDHFNAAIFKLTQQERQEFYKTADFELKRFLKI